ncbi:uncharacterized protein TNCV_295611 [Trichonephila clavipes]|nr:uncharacterized protein TNCV_295611 [Trichonephila clavipes]
MCQINNYKNALPAGRLIPIVSNYPNEIVTLDLLGPYPVSRVRIYRHRKFDETEIGTGSSDNGSLRDESSGFYRVQRRSIESQDGKKKGSGGPERKVWNGSEHRVSKRALSSNYRTNHSLTKFRKKSRMEETVTPTTSGYNLRPRIGKIEESQPTIQRKTSRSEQDQATRMPDEEVINNGKTRKGEERVQTNPCHWRSWWLRREAEGNDSDGRGSEIIQETENAKGTDAHRQSCSNS